MLEPCQDLSAGGSPAAAPSTPPRDLAQEALQPSGAACRQRWEPEWERETEAGELS